MTKRTRAANAAAMPIEEPIAADAAASAAAILAAAQASEGPSAAEAKEPDDAELLALRQPWQDLYETYRQTPSPRGDASVRRFTKAEDKIIRRLVSMSAQTLAGLAFKVEVSAANDHMAPELVASIMDDVAALAASTMGEKRLATFGDYAAAEFEAIATSQDLDELRPVCDENWTPLAMAMTFLAKSSNEMAEFAEAMEKDGEGALLTKLMESIGRSSKWFAKTAELMDNAQIRLMCGMSQSYKATGLPSEGL